MLFLRCLTPRKSFQSPGHRLWERMGSRLLSCSSSTPSPYQKNFVVCVFLNLRLQCSPLLVPSRQQMNVLMPSQNGPERIATEIKVSYADAALCPRPCHSAHTKCKDESSDYILLFSFLLPPRSPVEVLFNQRQQHTNADETPTHSSGTPYYNTSSSYISYTSQTAS